MIPPKRSLLLRIWREHLSRYAGRLALAFLFMIGLALAEVGFVLATEWIFAGLEPDRASRFADVNARNVMIWGPLLIIVLAIVQAGFFYLQALTAQGVGIATLRDLQNRMFGAILRYDVGQVKGRTDGEARVGGLVSRFTNDMTTLRETLRRAPNGLRDLVRLVGFIGVLAFLDPVLFLCVLLIYPLVGIPISIIGRAIRRLARRVQAQIGDMTGLLAESIGALETIKGYGLEEHERKRMAQAFEERRSLLMKLVRYTSANEPMVTVVASLSIAFIIAVAAWRIDAGLLTGPELVAFLIAMALLSQPARGLGTLNAVLQEGLAAMERVFGVIDAKPKIVDPPHPKPLPIEAGKAPAIGFENVVFSYDEGVPLLRGFNLDIPAGATAALVGPSGAGKSTVFGLLPRFYDPQAGRITINGTGVHEVSLAALRSQMSIVTQTPILFDTTIADNIRMGRQNASDAEVQAAAKAAAAHRFIERMPDGYNSRVGAGGNALSGGERQRIALARAFLKDAPILLLDEATSALDAESERLIEEAMKRLREGRTTLIIAHRLSTIRDADLIAVMQDGQLIEQGTHEGLLSQGGLYARLVALQDRQAEPA
ncbi:ABC transporter ATP-binding protein [Parvularcula lutaonensis]|uniref:ABC transporter ATP-binding protein n=1 Tax=Parvularcula lutaonensis TaxID=491923 RepID=A0ABV7MEK8_9PROT|nr:ABC transporter ATP-binding protein [Parvularcula lutaonensis]GGY39900.1 multidrug ABC transporter permease [Parvularcula lutaonensis]